MGATTRAVRAAAAEMIRPDPDKDPDTEKPAEPEETLTEERQRVVRLATQTYKAQLLPWKILVLVAVAGLVVHNSDTSVFTMLCLAPFAVIGAYWFTEDRLTFRHVGRGRLEMGERTGRRARRIGRRANRSARVAAAIGVWLVFVALTHPAHWTGQIVWTLGAILWAFVAYDGWWRPADTEPDTPFIQADDDEDDDPQPHPQQAHTPMAATTVPANRPPRRSGGRRGGVPVPHATGTAPGTGPQAAPFVPLPSPMLLATGPLGNPLIPEDDHSAAIQEVFTVRNMDVKLVGTPVRGPAVTRYTLAIAPAVDVKKVLRLEDQLRHVTGNPDLQVLSPVGGKPQIGVEVPNKQREVVPLGLILASPEAQNDKHPLLVAIGKDSDGNLLVARLSDWVHVLIGGATGGGKSGVINAIIVSLLARNTPDMLKLILIDPKRVELTRYNGVPHLLFPVITDVTRAINALDWLIMEMDQRYLAMEKAGVRHVDDYNRKVLTGEITAPPGLNHDLRPYPYIVCVIDELADLMLTAEKVDGENPVEAAVVKLTQLARAAGIHLVKGTQRPDVTVVTGRIKANVPTRIAVKTASNADSRVILDRVGAERLLGAGDALMIPNGRASLVRLQVAWVTDKEIEAVVKHWRDVGDTGSPTLPQELLDTPRGDGFTPAPKTVFDTVLDAARRLADPDTGEVTRNQIVAATPHVNEKSRNAAFTRLFKRELEHMKNGNFRVRTDEELADLDSEQEKDQ